MGIASLDIKRPHAPDHHSAAAAPSISIGDHFGQLASADTQQGDPSVVEQRVQDSLDNVTQSFHWFSDAAQRKLEGLRRHLKEADEPDWFARLAESLLEVALGAGAAAAGAHLAAKLVPEAGEAMTEYVKVMLEGGIGAGVTAGRSKLAPGNDDNVVDPFIDAQMEGVAAAQQANQRQFLHVGRHRARTIEQAQALEAACSQPEMDAAANRQYEATRDAWVSYLAQATFGAIGKHGAVTPDSLDVGPTTTNMATREQRKRTNAAAPGFVPDTAPDIRDASRGDAPGVLAIAARLPAITLGLQMHGQPWVEIAFLNGVNGKIRGQYENRPLADAHIPRQIVAKIDGETDLLRINLDEKGKLGHFLNADERRWLAERATVGHLENVVKSDWEKAMLGLQMLLDELVPTSIEKR